MVDCILSPVLKVGSKHPLPVSAFLEGRSEQTMAELVLGDTLLTGSDSKCLATRMAPSLNNKSKTLISRWRDVCRLAVIPFKELGLRVSRSSGHTRLL